MKKYSRKAIEKFLYDKFNYGISDGKVIEQLNQINQIYQDFKIKSFLYTDNKDIFDAIFGSLEVNINSAGKVQMNGLSFIFFISFLYAMKNSNSKIINFSSKKIVLDEEVGLDEFIELYNRSYEKVKPKVLNDYKLNFYDVITESISINEEMDKNEMNQLVDFLIESMLYNFLLEVHITSHEYLDSDIQNIIEELTEFHKYKSMSITEKEWFYNQIKGLNNRVRKKISK